MASREWAEKQRLRKLGSAGKSVAAAAAAEKPAAKAEAVGRETEGAKEKEGSAGTVQGGEEVVVVPAVDEEVKGDGLGVVA